MTERKTEDERVVEKDTWTKEQCIGPAEPPHVKIMVQSRVELSLD